MVHYPRSTNIETLEQVYQHEHVSKAVKNFIGKTKPVATRVL
jgi:hypothetical protein